MLLRSRLAIQFRSVFLVFSCFLVFPPKNAGPLDPPGPFPDTSGHLCFSCFWRFCPDCLLPTFLEFSWTLPWKRPGPALDNPGHSGPPCPPSNPGFAECLPSILDCVFCGNKVRGCVLSCCAHPSPKFPGLACAYPASPQTRFADCSGSVPLFMPEPRLMLWTSFNTLRKGHVDSRKVFS